MTLAVISMLLIAATVASGLCEPLYGDARGDLVVGGPVGRAPRPAPPHRCRVAR